MIRRNHLPLAPLRLLAVLLGAAGSAPAIDTEPALLRAFLRLGVVDQMLATVDELAAQTEASAAAQVRDCAATWAHTQRRSIGTDLSGVLGDKARERFTGFVQEFTAAEQRDDASVLAEFMMSLDLDAPVATYAALRARMVQRSIATDVEAAGQFLGEVHTWLDVRSRVRDAPPLRDWLDRATPATAAPPPPKVTVRAPRSGNPLRDAEAPAAVHGKDTDGTTANPRDALGAARSERRTAALAEAQAGMQQVAVERRTEEDALAAETLAAAQAAADATRKHAERLAATEAEAMEQRKNGWSARLKSLLTATIGATGGAFLGGVGGRVGEAAANAVFGEGPIATTPVSAQPQPVLQPMP